MVMNYWYQNEAGLFAKTIRNFAWIIIPHRFYKGGGSAPKSPDPMAQANAQFSLNKRTSNFEANQNRFTQNNPLGTISWTNNPTAPTTTWVGKGKNRRKVTTPGKPNWTQTTTLSPAQQAIFDTQQQTQLTGSQGANAAINRANTALANPMYSGMQDIANLRTKDITGGDLATRKHYEDALFQRLNPSLQSDEEALRARLANQGLQYGTEAYGNAMRDQNQRINDARLAVIAQGGQEMQLGQNLELARRNQMLSEIGAQQGADQTGRNQQLAEMAAMLQAQGNVNLPVYGGAQNVSSTNPVDIAGLMQARFNNQQGQANAQTAQQNALIGALGQLGGSYIGSRAGGK